LDRRSNACSPADQGQLYNMSVLAAKELGIELKETREKYTITDYFDYYLKAVALPTVIIATIVFILIKIILI